MGEGWGGRESERKRERESDRERERESRKEVYSITISSTQGHFIDIVR